MILQIAMIITFQSLIQHRQRECHVVFFFQDPLPFPRALAFYFVPQFYQQANDYEQHWYIGQQSLNCTEDLNSVLGIKLVRSPLIVVGCDSVDGEKKRENVQVIFVMPALFIWLDMGMKK